MRPPFFDLRFEQLRGCERARGRTSTSPVARLKNVLPRRRKRSAQSAIGCSALA